MNVIIARQKFSTHPIHSYFFSYPHSVAVAYVLKEGGLWLVETYSKKVENFSEHNVKIFTWKFHTVTEKSLKKEMMSLIYDVSYHVYSMSKSI